MTGRESRLVIEDLVANLQNGPTVQDILRARLDRAPVPGPRATRAADLSPGSRFVVDGEEFVVSQHNLNPNAMVQGVTAVRQTEVPVHVNINAPIGADLEGIQRSVAEAVRAVASSVDRDVLRGFQESVRRDRLPERVRVRYPDGTVHEMAGTITQTPTGFTFSPSSTEVHSDQVPAQATEPVFVLGERAMRVRR